MRTYYCKTCQETVTFKSKDIVKKCNSCSTIFETKVIKGHEINMRKKPWSATTKVEFNETTIESSINRMNRR
jgi:uncharacterized Zn finger protein